ncbi:IS3 family transposase [Streptomyces sp. NPDC127051]|uniref:IS3 family transposase n=1 Tax=Streptomyces sp. NPDC127051 TaxID=3347119 RepID=UPI0036511469
MTPAGLRPLGASKGTEAGLIQLLAENTRLARVEKEWQLEEDALVKEIREIHAELRGFGHTVNRKRVARLMRKHGTVGRHLRKKRRTRIPDRLAPPTADLVQRDFTTRTVDKRPRTCQ